MGFSTFQVQKLFHGLFGFFVLFFLKKKKKKGFSPMSSVPHLRKEECCHWGGRGLVSIGWISLREAWEVLVYTGKI